MRKRRSQPLRPNEIGRLVVSGRRNYVHSSATQIHMRNPVGPVREAEERSNFVQIYGHDLD